VALPLRLRVLLLVARLLERRPQNERTIGDVRRSLDKLRPRRIGRQIPVAAVRNILIPRLGGSIGTRFYTPTGGGPHPLLMFFHGGGWIWGDLDLADHSCRTLCRDVRCAVLSVDYRLAPEHKFPAAVDDCFGATQWAASQAASLGIDPTRIAVGGESGGGTLAAVTALRARHERGAAICGQLLIYPPTDHCSSRHDSWIRYGAGYGLTSEMGMWLWKQYLSNAAEADDPYASPLRATDLAGLPAALVITAEYDILRDEGERYAERLQQAGVAVKRSRYANTIHGFFSMPLLCPGGRAAMKDASEWLRERFQT
jgi:acetyl esterase/lipase